MKRSSTLLLFAFTIGCTLPAAAHKLNIFGYVEGNQVFIEGYFNDGIKPKNSDVTVSDLDGTVLVEGKTDQEGTFSFEAPHAEGLRIVLNTGMGHQADYIFSAQELAGAAPQTTLPANAQLSVADVAQPQKEPADNQEAPPTPAPATSGTNNDIDRIVRLAVAEAVKPLAREIAELKSKTSTSDIVGGAGIILGLLGGFAYYKSRKLSKG